MKHFPLLTVLSAGLLLFSCAQESEFPKETEPPSVETEEIIPPQTETPYNTESYAFAETPETVSTETVVTETVRKEPQPSETDLPETMAAETSYEETNFNISHVELPAELHTNIISDEAREILLEIHRLVSDVESVSVYYADVNELYYFGIGEDTSYHSASTIKAVYCQYLAESGADLAQRIPLTQVTRKSASGKLTESSLGKEFTVDELIQYTLRNSDNQAYNLLLQTFGKESYNRYVFDLGADSLMLSQDSEWAVCTPKDLSAAMLRVYHTEQDDPTIADHLKNTEYNEQISKGTAYETAHKYGYNGKNTGYHDVSIVYHTNSPYVLTVMTLLDPGAPETNTLFRQISFHCDKLNEVLFKNTPVCSCTKRNPIDQNIT